jgi:hypothetical protein
MYKTDNAIFWVISFNAISIFHESNLIHLQKNLIYKIGENAYCTVCFLRVCNILASYELKRNSVMCTKAIFIYATL